MAKQKMTSRTLEAQAKELLEKAKALKKQEETQKNAAIAKVVLKHHRNHFAGFSLEDFRREISDILAHIP